MWITPLCSAKKMNKNLFFTADSHFGHHNVIRYCNRPYENAAEMNEKLINNWNSVVPPKGTVYHLGDFFMGNSIFWEPVLNRLNGEIHLVKGNHDKKVLKEPFTSRFASVNDYAEIFVNDKDAPMKRFHIVMMHFPILSWNGSNHGSWHLHGHSHANQSIMAANANVKRLDVGVDNPLCGYSPFSFNQIKEIMESKTHLHNRHGDSTEYE